jgi:hypothetical protein
VLLQVSAQAMEDFDVKNLWMLHVLVKMRIATMMKYQRECFRCWLTEEMLALLHRSLMKEPKRQPTLEQTART